LTAGPLQSCEATFGPEGDSARLARAAVEGALTKAGVDPAAVTDALLILSELVSNAIRHARTEYTVSASVADGTVRLEVFDRDTRPPALMGLDAESTSGRGLHIVAGLATDWGWNTGESPGGVSGKVVWAEVSVNGRPAALPTE
jgi:anti-sigma regulatory factor (Ser/Thr protein kinase)